MKIILTERQLNYLVQNLFEDFKTQKIKYLEQGNDESIVDRYLKDFREIKDREYPEFLNDDLPGLNVPKGNDRKNIDNYKTFKEVELIVDYITGRRKVGSVNFSEIKVDGKPIYNDEDVEIYYAPNKESCIQYKGNKPYSWCISRSDASNMFMRYRTNQNRPSFYFIKRKNATNKEFDYWNTSGDKFEGKFNDKFHFFVVQVIHNGKYVVTSAMNDGDKQMTWKEILNIAPELQGKENYFQSKPLSNTEIEKYEKYKKGISDEEFIKLPYIEKEYYIDTAIEPDNKITDRQFASLPDDLKNKYINLGLQLTPKQLELIKDNKKLLRRAIDVTNEKFETEYITTEYGMDDNKFRRSLFFKFTPTEYNLLNEKNKNLADKDIERNINIVFKDLNETFEKYHKDEERFFGQLETFIIMSEMQSHRTRINPYVFYIKKFIPLSTLTELSKSRKFLLFLFFTALNESQETMKDLMNYIGIDYKKIISSFNDKQLNFYNEFL